MAQQIDAHQGSSSGNSKEQFIRAGSWLAAVVLVTLFAAGCSVKKPSAPSWDVDVSIPLISKVYTMDEIADYIGCSKATVWRACKRLQEAGQLRMIHVENRRFRYELMETVNVRSIRD